MTSGSQMNYKVGQKRYFESIIGRQRSDDHYLIVTHVGRKWVSLSFALGEKTLYKVTIDSVHLDGGDYTSPGRLWESKEACQAFHKIKMEWASLKRDIEYRSVPEGLTPEVIEQVRILLDVPKRSLTTITK